MVKLIYTWRDNPELGPERSEAHYRKVHMDLAREVFTGREGFVSLTYNRVRRHLVNDHNEPTPHPEPSDVDAFLELVFTDRPSLDAAFADPAMQVLFDDHANFMAVDEPRNIHVYEVDETVIL